MMERTVLLVRPEQRLKLDRLAAQEKVSLAEIHRRAIDAYNPSGEINDLELEKLAALLMESTTIMQQSLQAAQQEVKATLHHLRAGGAGHGHE